MILMPTFNRIDKKSSAFLFLVVLTTFLFCFHVESKTDNNAQTKKAISRKTKVNKSMDTKALKLSSYRWKNRILVVAGSETETFLKQQQLFKKYPTQNIERKLLLLYVKDTQILRELKLQTDKFAMVLIGLDGYIKKRYSKATEMSEIYEVIDAMPMRQSDGSN